MWLENEVPKGCLTEISASDHLEKLRSCVILIPFSSCSLSCVVGSRMNTSASVLIQSQGLDQMAPLSTTGTDALFVSDAQVKIVLSQSGHLLRQIDCSPPKSSTCAILELSSGELITFWLMPIDWLINAMIFFFAGTAPLTLPAQFTLEHRVSMRKWSLPLNIAQINN